MTLYITPPGFRFSHNRYTNISSHTNLRFLEAQLDRFLHSHETDDATQKLYVTPRGFRLPYQKRLTELERNMRFVERQLEEYLHEHEVVTTAGDPGGDLTFQSRTALNFDSKGLAEGGGSLWTIDSGAAAEDAIVELNPSTAAIINRIELPNNGGNFTVRDLTYDKTANTIWVYSDPLQATIHEVDPSDGTILDTMSPPTPNIWGMTNDGVHLWLGDLSTGDVYYNGSVVFSTSGDPDVWYLAYNLAEDHVWVAEDGNIEAHLYNTSGAALKVVDFKNDSGTEGIALTADGLTLYRSADIGFDSYIETYTAEASTADVNTLYTTPVGFRFPYDWDKTGSVNDNMKFFETQISQYLHTHEVGI